MPKRNKQKVVQQRWENKMEKGKQVKEQYIKPPVQARNENQKQFLKHLNTKDVVIFNAVAGVGKTFLTMSEVTDWLKKGIYDKLVIARPNILMGNTIGLLKGSAIEKCEPLMMPMIDVIKQRYGAGFYESSLHNGTIELQPLEYIRGRNFNYITVLDEAQLTTPEEMYTILTRLADGGKLIILGDPTQKDQKGLDGITWLLDFVKRHNLQHIVGYTEASSDDIERGGVCKAVVKAMEKDRAKGV